MSNDPSEAGRIERPAGSGELWRVDGSASNAFLVRDGDGDDAPLYLVDAGVPDDAGSIRATASNAGVDLGAVDGVLLTHYDYDHVGALADLRELDCPVYAHEPDASFLDGSDRPGLWPHKALLQRVTGLFLDRSDLPVERVADGDTVGSFAAYHTPGHGPGHLAWISADRGVAFLGDLVRVADGALEASPWAVSYDTAAVRDSVRDLDERAPEFEAVGVGHGDPLAAGGSEALGALAASLADE